ncbi:hypothetical protein ERJ75_000302300 [Trypanosoma vivax]|uniref:Uncharacterized protein n=1 Tax=Trypanosoma vivax (strain Y486) TaxID=1055687 RepID=F9WKA9_TRYVY|nr:hypothetical protein ERJ75_001207100 [Trypanosoma vivax]KAH8618176.1 hypothetical protein ERJ75_000302300 [Trypanosoma vivax]CCD17929.1 hypothetical protein, conserved in T. vivax [Trypanosoma vivax Y486]|eukprot:CCD17929.1 hypothetical protein, conserved in T. vivax [Trypanosoma vivax Y486]
MKSCDASRGIETTGRLKRLCFDLHALGMLGALATVFTTLSAAAEDNAEGHALTCTGTNGGDNGASFNNCRFGAGTIDNNNYKLTATFECTGSGRSVKFTCPITRGESGPGPNGTHENCTQAEGGQNVGSFKCGPGNQGPPEREAGKTDGSANTQDGTKGESTRDQGKTTEDKDSGDSEKSKEQDKKKDKTTEKHGDGPGHAVKARGAGTQPKSAEPKDAEPKNTIFVSTASFFSMNLPITGHFVLRSALSSFALGPSRLC